MTRRRELLSHLRGLNQVRQIIDAMKRLSFIETRRLDGRLDSEDAVIHAIETAATGLLDTHPQLADTGAALPITWIALGSERGFCGDFNERVAERLAADVRASVPVDPHIIAVGARLITCLGNDARVTATLPGASVADETDAVLAAIVDALDAERRAHGPSRVHVVHYENERQEPIVTWLLPPFRAAATAEAASSEPPLLQMAPTDLLLALGDQYLYAALRRILDGALMAENQRRVRQLEGAAQHLDERVATLVRRGNQLRQEEIIEEIEVILLSSATAPPWAPPSRSPQPTTSRAPSPSTDAGV
jgi:F-type H+-transporting ATPase subunit gamma